MQYSVLHIFFEFLYFSNFPDIKHTNYFTTAYKSIVKKFKTLIISNIK